jgi:hypothetical protein
MNLGGISIAVGLVALAFEIWPAGILILFGLAWLFAKS